MKKAPKELHRILDKLYLEIQKERLDVEKRGLAKTKQRKCKKIAGVTPIPFKSPFPYLYLELGEAEIIGQEDEDL